MRRYVRRAKLMGCSFELGVVDQDAFFARKMLDAGVKEIERLEILLTEFDSKSATSFINRTAGKSSVIPDPEVFSLISRCQAISELTSGYFDISIGPLKEIYKFQNKSFTPPSGKIVRSTLGKVGYNKIQLDPRNGSIRYKSEGMRISFAAIGKGYAADMVRQLWLESGVASGFINASGDISCIGTNEKGESWSTGIVNPDSTGEILFQIPLKGLSVATSGDYEQFFEYEGRRFSHTVNPKTGLPQEYIKSATLFSPSAELSDALATAVSAMGVTKGMRFIDKLPDTHVIIIDAENKIHLSKKLDYEAVY